MTSIEIDRPDRSMRAYSAHAEAPGSALPLVLIHEAFGLNAHIESIADRFAAAGHDVVAPHLHYRHRTTAVPYDDVPVAAHLVSQLTVDQIADDITAAAAALPGLPEHVGVVGFCFGGAVAYVAAARLPIVKRAVAYYPVSIVNYWDDVGLPRAPLLVLFGENDQFLGPDELAWLRELDRDATTPLSLHVFAGAGHAFFNDARPTLYEQRPATASWRLTLGFLSEHPRAPRAD